MTIGQQIVADLTDPLVLAGVALLISLHLAANGSVRAGVRFAASVALAWVAAQGLKFLVGDPRPAGGVIDAWGSGWPSGHSAVGAAAALALWFIFAPRVSAPRRAPLGLALVLGALLLAASRLYLGVHDLGDIAGGLSVGVLAGYLLRPKRRP